MLSFCSVISFADPLKDFFIKVRSEYNEESVNTKLCIQILHEVQNDKMIELSTFSDTGFPTKK